MLRTDEEILDIKITAVKKEVIRLCKDLHTVAGEIMYAIKSGHMYGDRCIAIMIEHEHLAEP